eukprot:9812270-Ditylum_brightwellii.AAC.1
MTTTKSNKTQSPTTAIGTTDTILSQFTKATNKRRSTMLDLTNPPDITTAPSINKDVSPMKLIPGDKESNIKEDNSTKVETTATKDNLASNITSLSMDKIKQNMKVAAKKQMQLSKSSNHKMTKSFAWVLEPEVHNSITFHLTVKVDTSDNIFMEEGFTAETAKEIVETLFAESLLFLQISGPCAALTLTFVLGVFPDEDLIHRTPEILVHLINTKGFQCGSHTSLWHPKCIIAMNPVNHKDLGACGILIGVDAHKYKHDYFGCRAVSHAIFNNLNNDLAAKAKSNRLVIFEKKCCIVCRTWKNYPVFWVYSSTNSFLAHLAQASKANGKLNTIYFCNHKLVYLPFTTKASEINAFLKVHIQNAIIELAEWRGLRIKGVKKGLTEEQLSELADHKLIETIDCNSTSLTDKEACINLYTADHFQTNRVLENALPA